MTATLALSTHRRLSLHSALTVFTRGRHWWASLVITVVLPVVAHHRGLSHTILTIILSMAAVLSVTAAHGRLTLHSALTVSIHRRLPRHIVLPITLTMFAHWGLSHTHSHTAVSDGICGVIDGYGFFIASGTDFIGLTVFKFRTAVKHGIVALCEIACREEFFSGLITDFYRVSGTAVSA